MFHVVHKKGNAIILYMRIGKLYKTQKKKKKILKKVKSFRWFPHNHIKHDEEKKALSRSWNYNKKKIENNYGKKKLNIHNKNDVR